MLPAFPVHVGQSSQITAAPEPSPQGEAFVQQGGRITLLHGEDGLFPKGTSALRAWAPLRLRLLAKTRKC